MTMITYTVRPQSAPVTVGSILVSEHPYDVLNDDSRHHAGDRGDGEETDQDDGYHHRTSNRSQRVPYGNDHEADHDPADNAHDGSP